MHMLCMVIMVNNFHMLEIKELRQDYISLHQGTGVDLLVINTVLNT